MRWSLGVAFLVGAAASACNSGSARCVPGQSSPCACANGMSGSQTCRSDDTYGTCVCNGAGDGDGGSAMKRIFTTKVSYAGNLATQGSASDGPTGADNLCNRAAQAAALGGTWKAWLSDSTTNAVDRIADVGPWCLLALPGASHNKAFNNKVNLMTLPLVPIGIDETGNPLPLGERVWTGTVTGGTKAVDAPTGLCRNAGADWADGAQKGLVGAPDSVTSWTDTAAASCQTANHLYCIEQ